MNALFKIRALHKLKIAYITIFQPVTPNFTPYFSYLYQGRRKRVVICKLSFKFWSTVENAKIKSTGQNLNDIFWKKIVKFYNYFQIRKNEVSLDVVWILEQLLTMRVINKFILNNL